MNLNKIKPNEIAFDIDEVVAAFLPLFLKVLKKESGIELSLKDITDFELSTVNLPKKELRRIVNKAVNNPFNMKMMPGAKEVINKLLDKGQVTFVTARKNGKLITQWIHNELGFSDIVVVAMNGHDNKARALKRRGILYFVDDRLKTCHQLYEEGITPIIFSHPHNIGDIYLMRVNNWEEIDALIDWS